MRIEIWRGDALRVGLKTGTGALLMLFALAPLPGLADLDVAQTLHDARICLSATGAAPRATCERAYVAFAQAKAQLKVGLLVGQSNPPVLHAIQMEARSIGNDYGVNLTAEETPVMISTMEYVLALRMGEDGVLRKSPSDPQNKYDFTRALNMGREVLASTLDTSNVRKMKQLVRVNFRDVQGFANWKDAPRH